MLLQKELKRAIITYKWVFRFRGTPPQSRLTSINWSFECFNDWGGGYDDSVPVEVTKTTFRGEDYGT